MSTSSLDDAFGIDLHALHLLLAVHDDGHHAAAGGRLDAQIVHLLLQALLHLLRLFHHLLDVHRRLHLLDVSDLSRKHVEHRLNRGVGHGFGLEIRRASAVPSMTRPTSTTG